MTADSSNPGSTQPPLLILREKFFFMEDGAAEQARYERLAYDSFAVLGWLPGIGCVSFREPSPRSAFFFIYDWERGMRDGKYSSLPDDLDWRWRDWSRRYYEIRSRSPKLEMRDLLQDITERQDGRSWPFYASEHILEEWILAGDFDAPMGSDLYSPEYVTRKTFGRLRELRLLTGGWIYDDGHALRFAAGEEWQEVKRELRELRGG
jgi:hypothetical protein